MDEIKVMMVCESFGGGVFAYVSQLCNDLIDFFEIHLVYSVRPQTPSNFKEKLDPRIKLYEIKNFGNLKKLHSTKKQLKKLEDEIKPNIIHLHSSIAGAIGRMTFKGKKNTVLYTPHGYAHILLGKGFKSKLYRFVEKVLGKKNCITLTCCESEDYEARKFSKKTAFIETGINVEAFDKVLSNVKSDEKKEFTCFTLGRVCTQKQPQIFNEIALLVPNVKFVWIGSGELENQLTAPNIEVTGWKSREEALSIAKKSDIFILCSLGEAIAMSLLENLYLKKLCLVSNTIGNKSVIVNSENGYICDSPQEYAKRIIESEKNYPNNLIENGYNDILKIYNTNVMKVKYKKYYEKLVKEKKNG